MVRLCHVDQCEIQTIIISVKISLTSKILGARSPTLQPCSFSGDFWLLKICFVFHIEVIPSLTILFHEQLNIPDSLLFVENISGASFSKKVDWTLYTQHALGIWLNLSFEFFLLGEGIERWDTLRLKNKLNDVFRYISISLGPKVLLETLVLGLPKQGYSIAFQHSFFLWTSLQDR